MRLQGVGSEKAIDELEARATNGYNHSNPIWDSNSIWNTYSIPARRKIRLSRERFSVLAHARFP